MSDPVESFEYRGYQVEIIYDHDAEDPLNGYDDVKLYAPHRRYRFGNVNHDAPKGTRIKVPVYMYDHSGLAVSTTPFSCHWDSGRLGTMFIENEDLKNIDTGDEMDYLMSVFSEWSYYVSGEAYCLDISLRGEVIESISGHFGLDGVKEAARDTIDMHITTEHMARQSEIGRMERSGLVEAFQLARYA